MKRILSIILAAVMLAVSLTALASCGNSVDASKDVENIKKAGVLKVGMECAYAPYNWTQTNADNDAVKIKNADGYANGYDVQAARKIAASLGVELEIYAYKWDALIPAVESGTIDCVIAGMSPTAERKAVLDFSDNYYVSNLVIIVREDGAYANAQSLADFKGCSIGAQAATFHAEALKQIEDVKENILDDFTLLYTALTANTIDGYVAEEPTAYSICSEGSGLTFAPLVNNSTGFTCDEGDTAIAVGVRKGSDLAAAISEIVDGISDSERSELMMKMVSIAPVEE
ncbi:MAG: ABC transporter substrate-binding protein [Oscillospiraceae bacterium]|jgi:amino acid ABC transporter, amino acid-binding/permease protein|nr:MAG: ABC transporter substrate-binding protein [Oscillospiraceae bacterium]